MSVVAFMISSHSFNSIEWILEDLGFDVVAGNRVLSIPLNGFPAW